MELEEMLSGILKDEESLSKVQALANSWALGPRRKEKKTAAMPMTLNGLCPL